jgi:hypothetical protein
LAAPEPELGVFRPALVTHLEVQAGPFDRAGLADPADQLTALYLVSLVDQDLRGVGVEGVVTVAVIQD